MSERFVDSCAQRQSTVEQRAYPCMRKNWLDPIDQETAVTLFTDRDQSADLS
jgi:hypothetical protein